MNSQSLSLLSVAAFCSGCAAQTPSLVQMPSTTQTSTSAPQAKVAQAPALQTAARSPASTTKFDLKWSPVAGEVAPIIEVCPLQYGKTWAYSVEIDDGPASTLSVVAPLLEGFSFSDAPPGMSGGKAHPFVGGAAIYLARFDSGNPTLLSRKDTALLRARGWGMLNHSYWHSGNHWDKTQANTPEQFRRELFWSQCLWPDVVGGGRAATHFVYPNGDPGYGKYLSEFGLASASRVGGASPHRADGSAVWGDLDRNYLDEGVWSQSNNALAGLSESPKAGDFTIDFTHGIEAPGSINYKRWQTRLEHIAGKWGAKGEDSLWCAPTDAVVDYARAAAVARVSAKVGGVHVELPPDVPGSALTLHLRGLDKRAHLVAPVGGALFRQGDQAWITTPVLGQVGVKPPAKLKCVWRGPVGDVTLDALHKIAGVRVLQQGDAGTQWKMSIQVGSEGGPLTEIVAPDKAVLGQGWGTWQLFPIVPDRQAITAQSIHATPNKVFAQMEVWVLDE